MTRATTTGRVVPESIKDMDIWVLWDVENKSPLAPWNHGHMYRATWREGMVDDPDVDVDERPERPYRDAKMMADVGPNELHQAHPFPQGDIPDEVRPTILLPHDPDEPRLMQVDFDDVRDPETGEVTEEAWEIVDELDSYTEVSSSGTGLHVFVFASLPGRLEKFLADLDVRGGIEMYDHGRFVGATWDHVEETPETARTPGVRAGTTPTTVLTLGKLRNPTVPTGSTVPGARGRTQHTAAPSTRTVRARTSKSLMGLGTASSRVTGAVVRSN